MVDKKFCEFCGTPLIGETIYCANCGRFVTSSPPQPASGQGSIPSLDEEILRNLRDLIFPITWRKLKIGSVLIILLLFLVAVVAVASNNHPNPAPAVTATSTPKASASQPAGERDDKAVQFEDMLVKQGMTVVKPFTKSVNGNGNDVYTGSFKDSKHAYSATIDVCKSSDYSASRYNAQVAQLKSKGFSTYNRQESKELWVGYNANSKQSVEVKRFTGSDKTLYLSIMFGKNQ
jgi:hypothetical protein